MFYELFKVFILSSKSTEERGRERERAILLDFVNNGTITCLPSVPHVLCNLGISTKREVTKTI
jgi:hypothetical protein